jgi:hypothetical protein
MKVLSIDVGIKNLAYCLFEGGEILLWDVINLCGAEAACSQCKKKAKYADNAGIAFCQTHAKKTNHLLPTADLSLKKIQKMKITELHQLVLEQKIEIPATIKKKEDLLRTVLAIMTPKLLVPITQVAAKEMNLVKLGIALRNAFDQDLINHIMTIDCIIIENQISPIANRMKTLQGMIAQYFIMREKTNVVFVSAVHKLGGSTPLAPLLGENEGKGGVEGVEGVVENDGKGGVEGVEGVVETDGKGGVGDSPPAGPQGYADRKKAGVKITLKLLEENYIQWLPHFKQHKKKDDLADAFLQGRWYCNKKCINEIM